MITKQVPKEGTVAEAKVKVDKYHMKEFCSNKDARPPLLDHGIRESTISEKRTINNLESLHSSFSGPAIDFIHELQLKTGYEWVVNEGYRTYETQDDL